MSDVSSERVAAMSDLELEDRLQEPSLQPNEKAALTTELARRFSAQLLGDQPRQADVEPLQGREINNPQDLQLKPTSFQPATPIKQPATEAARPLPAPKLPASTPRSVALPVPPGPSGTPAFGGTLRTPADIPQRSAKRSRRGYVAIILLVAVLAGIGALAATASHHSTNSNYSPTQAAGSSVGGSGTGAVLGTDSLKLMNDYCRGTLDPAFKSVPLDFAGRNQAIAVAQEAADRYLETVVVAGPDVTASAAAIAAVKQMTAYWDLVALKDRDAASAYTAGDSQSAGVASQAADVANAQGNQVANQLGLTDCANAGNL